MTINLNDEQEEECTCGNDNYKTCFCECGWLEEHGHNVPMDKGQFDLKLQFEQEARELQVNLDELDSIDSDSPAAYQLAIAHAHAATAAAAPPDDDKIFKPKPRINLSIVGNVKDSNEEELIRFLKTVSSNNIFVITREFGKTKDNEHLHFYVEKSHIQLDTIKKKLRDDSYFKKLKGKTAGGDHKYNIKTLTDKIQYYYIFKEIPKATTHEKNTKRLYFEGVTITPALVLNYQHNYEMCLQHKKLSASNKFFFWVKSKYPDRPDYYKSKEKLIDCYLDYSVETNRAVINKYDCEKMINYVIVRTDPGQLNEEFKRDLIRQDQY